MPEFELNKVKSTKLVGANEFLPLSPINDKKDSHPLFTREILQGHS